MLQDQWAREHLTVQVRGAGDERALFWIDAVCPVVAEAASTEPDPPGEEEEQHDALVFGFASRGEAIRALRPMLEADSSSNAQACLAELESAERDTSLDDNVDSASPQ